MDQSPFVLARARPRGSFGPFGCSWAPFGRGRVLLIEGESCSTPDQNPKINFFGAAAAEFKNKKTDDTPGVNLERFFIF